MQPSRKQCTNGTQNQNFVLKICRDTPWWINFPKNEEKIENQRLTAVGTEKRGKESFERVYFIHPKIENKGGWGLLSKYI